MRTPEQSIAIHQCLRILGKQYQTFAQKREQIYGARFMARWLLDEEPKDKGWDEIWNACLELCLSEMRGNI